MKKWLKNKLLSYLVKDLLCAVDESMVLTEVKTSDGRSYYLLNGEKIDVEYLARLRQDCNILKESELWKILQNTLRSQAHRMIFIKSQNFDDVLSGKLMVYNLDVQKRIIETISEIRLQ